ncbi:MAG: hypothetical protein H7X94_15195 [Vallitaleaceae bacterium]|nr:hypothetical protein [Vallitaleaceae bacterium]
MSSPITKSQNQPATTAEFDINTGRYAGILSAIEFFSQKFELEQLISYAFDFSNDLLQPDQIAIWNLQDQQYILSQSNGYETAFTFEYQQQYDQIVYFHAGLMYGKNISLLLPPEISEVFNPDFCIPLIMDKSFFGIIALKRSGGNPFNSEDEIFASALMNLFSSALTNYSSYKHIEIAKAQLDQKIFNLFAMNHSTKALLSELSLNNLYDLAISVFSELTQSSFTTFFIKDVISENYKLMGCKNVRSHTLNLDITLFENHSQHSRLPILIDMSDKKNRDLFLDHFFNGSEILQKINPLYIVLLKKSDEIVGFVSLGTKVNDTKYDNSIFELVESLASATYIAISNALYIEEINKQKLMMDTKLRELVRLNELMKNINSANSYDKVIQLVMDTLNVSFGVDMGFFALYNEETSDFTVPHKINMKKNLNHLEMIPQWLPLTKGEPILVYEEEKVVNFLPKEAINAFIKNPSGVALIPVYMEQIDIRLIGFFALLTSRKKYLVTEESLVSLDAIATHIAPVIYQLEYSDGIKNSYKPDYAVFFLKKLRIEIEEAIDFGLDLFVVHISHKCPVHFASTAIITTLKESFKNCYETDHRNTFILTNKTTELSSIEELLTDDYLKKVYQLHQDFTDYESFLNIFI